MSIKQKWAGLSRGQKTAIVGGAALGVGALALWGWYNSNKNCSNPLYLATHLPDCSIQFGEESLAAIKEQMDQLQAWMSQMASGVQDVITQYTNALQGQINGLNNTLNTDIIPSINSAWQQINIFDDALNAICDYLPIC